MMMRWIANLIVVMAVVVLFGCSSIDLSQASTETTYVTLVGRTKTEPFLRYLRLQGVAVEVDDVGRTRLVNDQKTLTALNRWLMLQQAIYEVTAKNIANMKTLYDAQGNYAPYRRQIVGLDDQNVARVITDQGPLKKVYQPSHTDTDDQGFVHHPNIDPEVEMEILADVARQYTMTERLIQRLDPTAVRVTWYASGDYFDLMDRIIKTKTAVKPSGRSQLLANHPVELDLENGFRHSESAPFLFFTPSQGIVPLDGREDHEKLSAEVDRLANEIANLNTTDFNASPPKFEDLLYVPKEQPGVENANGNKSPAGLYIGLGTSISNTQTD